MQFLVRNSCLINWTNVAIICDFRIKLHAHIHAVYAFCEWFIIYFPVIEMFTSMVQIFFNWNTWQVHVEPKDDLNCTINNDVILNNYVQSIKWESFWSGLLLIQDYDIPCWQTFQFINNALFMMRIIYFECCW